MTFAHAHLLGIEPLSADDITTILDLAETMSPSTAARPSMATCWPG